MSDAIAPEGWHTVTPRIVARDARQLIEFLRAVFEATGDYRPDFFELAARSSQFSPVFSLVSTSGPGSLRVSSGRLD